MEAYAPLEVATSVNGYCRYGSYRVRVVHVVVTAEISGGVWLVWPRGTGGSVSFLKKEESQPLKKSKTRSGRVAGLAGCVLSTISSRLYRS